MQGEAIVEESGAKIFGVGFENREAETAFFEFAVGQAELVHEVDAGDFEPSEVIGVVG